MPRNSPSAAGRTPDQPRAPPFRAHQVLRRDRLGVVAPRTSRPSTRARDRPGPPPVHRLLFEEWLLRVTVPAAAARARKSCTRKSNIINDSNTKTISSSAPGRARRHRETNSILGRRETLCMHSTLVAATLSESWSEVAMPCRSGRQINLRQTWRCGRAPSNSRGASESNTSTRGS